jgi:SAM-dependent methyltransferase
MNFAGIYAECYDLFYGDKDYAAEARFVLDLAAQFGVRSKRVLDLGCGTGRHALEWAGLGIEVHGIERSQAMLDQAAARVPEACRHLLTLSRGDLRELQVAAGSFDLVTAMFAVLGYVTDEGDLLDLFRRIRAALRPGGLFICDAWHGVAVLKEGPGERLAVFDRPQGRLYRFARSRLVPGEHVVAVHYTVVDTAGCPAVHHEETHHMRFFTAGEMRLLAKAADLELACSCPFMEKDRPLGLTDWNACWVFQKRG